MQREAGQVASCSRKLAVAEILAGRQLGAAEAGHEDRRGGVLIGRFGRRRRDGEGDRAVLVDVVGNRRRGERGLVGRRIDRDVDRPRVRGRDIAVVVGARRHDEVEARCFVVAGMRVRPLSTPALS